MRRCFCRGRSIFTRPPAVRDPLGASGGAVTDRCHRPLVPCYLPLVSSYGRYQTSTPRSVGLRVRGSPRGRVTLAQTSSFSIAKREEAIFCFRLHATCRPGCWRGRRVQVWLSDSPLSLLCVGAPAPSRDGAFIKIEAPSDPCVSRKLGDES